MSLPTSGITTSLVRDTLGETSESAGGAGNNVGKLCSSSKIKPFNLYKPTRFGAPFTEFWNEGVGDSNEFYQGISTFGIRKPYLTTFNGSVKFASLSGVLVGSGLKDVGTWSYDSPRGTSTEPYRLGDFRGYCHDTIYYPYSHNTIPLYVSINVPFGKVAPDALPSAYMLYDFEDYENKRLGLKNLFKHNGNAGDYDMWFGIMMCSANDGVGFNRTVPVYCYYINNTKLVDSSAPITIELPMSNYISDSAINYQTHFIKGENVKVIPFIVIDTLQGYRIFPLITDDAMTPAIYNSQIAGMANVVLQPLVYNLTDSTYIRNNLLNGDSAIYFMGQTVSVYNPNNVKCSTNFSPPKLQVFALYGVYMVDCIENFNLPSSVEALSTSAVSYDGQITKIVVSTQAEVTINVCISWMDGSLLRYVNKNYTIPAV